MKMLWITLNFSKCVFFISIFIYQSSVHTSHASLHTSLADAVSDDDRSKVLSLLEKRANPNALSNGPLGEPDKPLVSSPAIHFANSEEIIEILLKNGADINGKNSLGKTALECTAQEGRNPMVKILLKKDARNADKAIKFAKNEQIKATIIEEVTKKIKKDTQNIRERSKSLVHESTSLINDRESLGATLNSQRERSKSLIHERAEDHEKRIADERSHLAHRREEINVNSTENEGERQRIEVQIRDERSTQDSNKKIIEQKKIRLGQETENLAGLQVISSILNEAYQGYIDHQKMKSFESNLKQMISPLEDGSKDERVGTLAALAVGAVTLAKIAAAATSAPAVSPVFIIGMITYALISK